MKPRIEPVKLHMIAIVLVDVTLFILLVFASYALFSSPARAENVCCPTNTPVPTQTCPPKPSATNTPEPSPTDTTEPSATNTSEPSQTHTVTPSATNTPEPSQTNTITPSSTSTSEPSPTHTITPSATSTLGPSPTGTTTPSMSPTYKPTSTLTSTAEPPKTPTPTKKPPHATATPSPTFKLRTSTPTATSTSEVTPCTSCYIVKDFKEIIVTGLYTADLLNTEDFSSTLQVSITLYDGYKGVVIGETINMSDTQPASEVMHVEAPVWCIDPITSEVYWIHSVVSAQRTTGEIWFVMDEWVRINLAEDKMKGP